MGWTELLEQAGAYADAELRPLDNDGPIPDGRRNSTLTSLAGALRRVGADEAVIATALHDINRRRCQPPLPADDLARIAASVSRYEPEPEPIRIADSPATAEDEREVTAEQQRPWPTPLEDAAFHGPLGAVVKAIAEHTEADAVGILGSLVAYFGGLCGGWRTMHSGGWHAANLFIVLVGDTADARKGVADSAARAVVELVEPDYRKLIVPTGFASGEAVVGHLSRLAADGGDEHRAIIRASELGGLLTVMSREGNTLESTVRDLWDGVPVGRFKADREQRVEWHHVALVGNVTTDELLAKLNSVSRSNGFGNRFLFLAVRSTRVLSSPPDPKRLVSGKWAGLARALEKARTRREMSWTPDAFERWDPYYRERRSLPIVGAARALTARHVAQVLRIALVYALADGADAVDLPHLEAGIALAEYGERSVRYIFGDSTGNAHADALLQLLRAGDLGRKEAKSELGLRHAADMDEVERLLLRTGLISMVEQTRPGGGRRRRVYRAKDAKGAKGTRGGQPNEA